MKKIEQALRIIAGVEMPIPPTLEDFGENAFRPRNSDEGIYDHLAKKTIRLEEGGLPVYRRSA